MDGWAQIKDQADWTALVQRTDADLDSGAFLIERLGGERHLEPALIAALLSLRRRLIVEHEVSDAAGLMLLDTVLISYFHLLRVNGWIGNAALLLEHEFFGLDGPTAQLQRYHGRETVTKLAAEASAERISQQLLPLLDRLNRMLERGLRALRERRQGRPPNVLIGSAEQVNIAQQQLVQQVREDPIPEATVDRTKRRR